MVVAPRRHMIALVLQGEDGGVFVLRCYKCVQWTLMGRGHNTRPQPPRRKRMTQWRTITTAAATITATTTGGDAPDVEQGPARRASQAARCRPDIFTEQE